MSNKFKNLYKNYLGTTGNSIPNNEYWYYLQELVEKNGWFNQDYNVQDEFLDFWPQWIASSQLNKVEGLDRFPFRYVSLGTTQTLDWFHYECARQGLRMRLLRGEYPYNRDVHDFDWDWFIDDVNDLKVGDAVIMSIPFSGSGHIHPMFYDILKKCDSLRIPVMLDCAWFGTCYDLEWTVDFNCVKIVSFSTTKSLGCGQWRSGICFTKWKYGPMYVQTDWHHGIHMNTFIGLELMKKFGPDTSPNKYKGYQKEICEYFGLVPTNTVHIAVGNKQDWSYFQRDGSYNRINIAKPINDLYKKKFYKHIEDKINGKT